MWAGRWDCNRVDIDCVNHSVPLVRNRQASVVFTAERMLIQPRWIMLEVIEYFHMQFIFYPWKCRIETSEDIFKKDASFF